jgi:hypothetical protein
MVECEFLSDNLLVERFSGVVTVEDIIELKRQEFGHRLYSPAMGVLIESDPDVPCLPPESIGKLLAFYNDNLNRIRGQRIAVLIEGSRQEIINSHVAYLMKKYVTEIHIQLFSSREMAIKWLVNG